MSNEIEQDVLDGLTAGLEAGRLPNCAIDYIASLAQQGYPYFCCDIVDATPLNGKQLHRAERNTVSNYCHQVIRALLVYDNPENYEREAELAIAAIFLLNANRIIDNKTRKAEIGKYLAERWQIPEISEGEDSAAAYDEWLRRLSIRQVGVLNTVLRVEKLVSHVLPKK